MAARVVPDNLREHEPLTVGRTPTTELSKRLLEGRTMFDDGPKRTFGSLYSLAKRHGLKAHTQRKKLNSVLGYLIWFHPKGEHCISCRKT